MYEGKDPLKTVDQYCNTFPETNRAKSAIKTKEKQVRQRLFEKIQPQGDVIDKTRMYIYKT